VREVSRDHFQGGASVLVASAARHKYDPGWADAALPRGTCARSAPNQQDVPCGTSELLPSRVKISTYERDNSPANLRMTAHRRSLGVRG
jgi:hypothetical protein